MSSLSTISRQLGQHFCYQKGFSRFIAPLFHGHRLVNAAGDGGRLQVARHSTWLTASSPVNVLYHRHMHLVQRRYTTCCTNNQDTQLQQLWDTAARGDAKRLHELTDKCKNPTSLYDALYGTESSVLRKSTILMAAACQGHRDVVDWILTHARPNVEVKGVVNIIDGDHRRQIAGMTALLVACRQGHFQVVKTLIEKGKADVNAVSDDGATSLMWACAGGNVDIIKYLLQQGLDMKGRDLHGWTPLHFVALYGQASLVDSLIQHGVELEAQDHDQWTPLHLAAAIGHTAVVMALEKVKVNMEAKTKNQFTALHLAAQSGHVDAIDALLNAGASVAAVTLDVWSPLHLAAKHGFVDAILQLIKRGAAMDAKSINGHTPLHTACQHGHVEAVKVLITARSNIEAKTKHGATVLHVAAEQGHIEIMDALIRARVNVNARTDRQFTALHLAAQNGNLLAVQALLKAGADATLKTEMNFNPFHLAAYYNQEQVVEYMLTLKEFTAQEKSYALQMLAHSYVRKGPDDWRRVCPLLERAIRLQASSNMKEQLEVLAKISSDEQQVRNFIQAVWQSIAKVYAFRPKP